MTASKTGRLIGYARVSTRDQNPNMQIDALKSQGCDPIFVESASGRNLERPKLEAALQALNPGDTLVVWRLSRLEHNPTGVKRGSTKLCFKKKMLERRSVSLRSKRALERRSDSIRSKSALARSVRHIIAVSDFLQAHQIGLKVLDQAIDTTTPAGRLFFHIIAAFDEFQREIIAENTVAGLKAAQQRGKTLGRPRKLDEAQTREAFEMLVLEEISVEHVAEQFEVSHMTLRRAFAEYGLEWPETNKSE